MRPFASVHVVALPVLLGLQATAQEANHNSRPSYQPFRYDEDWSFLADPSQRTDWLDPLKYVRLDRSGWYVTVGGELRERFELLDQPAFGVGPKDNNGYFLQRYLLSSDFHFGPRVRFFTELQSGLENGRNGGPRPTDLDRLDGHQGFLEWKVSSAEKHSVSIRVGRQEVGFGSGRLLSPAEGLNLRRSMDGVRITITNGKLVCTPAGQVVTRNLRRCSRPRSDVLGSRVTAPHPVWKHANVSLYYMALDKENSIFVKGAGRTIRYTIGSRSWKTSPRWDLNYEGIVQWGSFQGRSIHAWALSKTPVIPSSKAASVLVWASDPTLQAGMAVRARKRSVRSIHSFPRRPSTPVRPGCSGLRI
jgi:hypothetical protein